MYGSLTTEAKSACSAASRAAFTAVTISMGAAMGAAMADFLEFGGISSGRTAVKPS